MAVVTWVGRLTAGIICAGSIVVASAPAYAIDAAKWSGCMQDMKRIFSVELDTSNPTKAGTRTLQQFGGMVGPNGRLDQVKAMDKFAQCGVPAGLFRVQIEAIESVCNMKPGIREGKGDKYWDKLVRCLIEQFAGESE
ncbi:hypothetical protein ACIBCD_38595 [Nocardia brasiliensis]|uniref:hypothetical protein n=1 Tax=Nocardia brasiliensis TaxID=37326 RepID=UPI0037A8239C